MLANMLALISIFAMNIINRSNITRYSIERHLAME